MTDTVVISPVVDKPKLADPVLQHEVEQFYYWEAKLLNDRRYMDWFSLLAEDLQYLMPIRSTRIMREQQKEWGSVSDFAHFDEDHISMRGRIKKITSDVSWSENPASRTRHAITNVMILDGERTDKLEVSSVFFVYRNRLERQVDIFAGERRDVLRRSETDAGFEIARRTVLLDQSTILSNNLSFFF
ncbi:3-phenylpropionate/cinnamic acid dioxygenase subunit beta [Rhodococcus erythropolis]|uniref:Terminal dioxygenase, small subunit n=3 Tax=Rhodococcus TaxID=1827 RepID=Q79EQ1_RHOER|nr:terminal dioxygenase, small subunit [Rhodococcus sp. M5]BAA25620.1 terminal dioxygenase, small subunit [Rhodococcus erythropolis]CAA56347.1 small subunit of the biphenyl dioxygenase [Rhodococcus globerulus]